MSEQADLFPKDAEKAKEQKGKDVVAKLKKRHKSTQFVRDLRRFARTLKDKPNAEPANPDSIIVNPRYK